MSGTRADWLAWPVKTITAAVVLQPNLVLSGWTNVGGATPDVYAISLPRLVLTDVVTGGVYQKCAGLTENETPLTERASLALTQANAGSWFWDASADTLYAHSSTGSDPDLFTVYFAQAQLHLSSDGRVINLTDGDASTGIAFRPWLSGELPTVTREMNDFFTGSKVTATAQLQLLNTAFAFHRLLASDGDYWWKNTPVRFYLGGSYNGLALEWSQYIEYLTMLVTDTACDDVHASLELQPLQRLLSTIDLPPAPYFEGAYPNAGEGVRGRKIPIGYGRAIRRPDLSDTTVNEGQWTIADPTYQTLFAVHSVTAIDKSAGTRTALTVTTQYTVDLTGCTVTIVDSAYGYDTHLIEVDVTGKPDGAGGYLKTVGAIVQDMLTTFVGAPLSSIDTAAFEQADQDAPEELAVWLPDTADGTSRVMSSVLASGDDGFASIEGSVFATVKQSRTGQWTISVWTPGADASTAVALTQEDFIEFHPLPRTDAIYSSARVYYGRNHGTGEWSSEVETNNRTKYLSQSRSELPRYTFLRDSSAASIYAKRVLFMMSAQPQDVAFRLRTHKLAESIEGDKVLVTRAPALAASGAWVGKVCEIQRLEITPMLETSGILTDDRGLGNILALVAPDGTPDWGSASDDEKRLYGFVSDDAGFVDPADPSTLDIKVAW